MSKTMPGKSRGPNFSKIELTCLLDLIENIRPTNSRGWEAIAAAHGTEFPEMDRTEKTLRRKFSLLHSTKIPPTNGGEHKFPPIVLRAKRIYDKISIHPKTNPIPLVVDRHVSDPKGSYTSMSPMSDDNLTSTSDPQVARRPVVDVSSSLRNDGGATTGIPPHVGSQSQPTSPPPSEDEYFALYKGQHQVNHKERRKFCGILDNDDNEEIQEETETKTDITQNQMKKMQRTIDRMQRTMGKMKSKMDRVLQQQRMNHMDQLDTLHQQQMELRDEMDTIQSEQDDNHQKFMTMIIMTAMLR